MNKRQIEKRISLIPESSISSAHIKDPEYLFLLKKTEKIIIATYVLTDFIPNTEPLKRTLKDNSHQTLNKVCDLLHERSDRADNVQAIKSLYLKLLTQYDLASLSGFITRMNSQIIKDEINNLLRIIDDLERELTDEMAPDFKTSYFNVDIKNKRQYSKNKKTVPSSKIAKGQEDVKDSKVLYRKDSGNMSDMHKIDSTNSSKDGERDQRILEIIKDKKIVSIKDISELIFDCSEKTIQRTLNKMIEEGKIEKNGERRWAKYQVV